jgi:hypothetical protein
VEPGGHCCSNDSLALEGSFRQLPSFYDEKIAFLKGYIRPTCYQTGVGAADWFYRFILTNSVRFSSVYCENLNRDQPRSKVGRVQCGRKY